MSISIEELATYPLCAGLADEELRQVQRLLRRVAFMPGSLVMSQEQPGTAAFLVASGTLHVSYDQADGESVILAVLGPRALVGELGVVQSAGRSATVVAVEKLLLYALHRDDFHRCLAAIPQLSRNLNAILAQRLRLANAQIVTLATKDRAARVARTLCIFATEHGVAQADGSIKIPYRLTQGDLVRVTNLARPTVNRVMTALVNSGALKVDARQRITLHSTHALKQICGA